jgi:hypothetical protein
MSKKIKARTNYEVTEPAASVYSKKKFNGFSYSETLYEIVIDVIVGIREVIKKSSLDEAK